MHSDKDELERLFEDYRHSLDRDSGNELPSAAVLLSKARRRRWTVLLTSTFAVAFLATATVNAGWFELGGKRGADPARATQTPTTIPPGELETVHIYLAPEPHGGDEADRSAYKRVPRFVSQARSPADRARLVLLELLRGTTTEEEKQGGSSIFSEETAGMLNGVSLGNGHLVVDFEDLREVIPHASASTAGTVFHTQLAATLFELPRVQSIEFQINGDCAAFWEWLQSGCHTVTRAWWEQGAVDG